MGKFLNWLSWNGMDPNSDWQTRRVVWTKILSSQHRIRLINCGKTNSIKSGYNKSCGLGLPSHVWLFLISNIRQSGWTTFGMDVRDSKDKSNITASFPSMRMVMKRSWEDKNDSGWLWDCFVEGVLTRWNGIKCVCINVSLSAAYKMLYPVYNVEARLYRCICHLRTSVYPPSILTI